jgi:hypothetical protein
MTRLTAFFGASVFLAVILPAAALHRSSMFVGNELSLPTSADWTGPMRRGSVGTSTVSKQQIVTEFGKLPLSFEANRGQTDPSAKFISRSQGNSVFLTDTEMVLALSQHSSPLVRRADLVSSTKMKETIEDKSGTAPAVLRIKLLGANPEPRVEGLEELPGKSNYFIGNDPAKWRTEVSNYAKVKYEAVYPGVDLVYYGNQGQLENDFVVAPGTDPKVVQLGFQGAENLRIDAQGDLILRVGAGEVRLHKPIAYQLTPASGSQATDSPIGKQFVTARYILRSNRVAFAVAQYNTSEPLVIDPTLSYSTYLGGSGSDSGSGIAVDVAGAAYVTGQTSSTDFPTTNPVQGTSGGTSDVFVAKLSSSGATLLYSTYLGGSNSDFAAGIAVDASGNAYVTGQTSSTNFPTKNPFQGALGGSGDAFLAKLDNSGSTLLYSTYLGGSGSDFGAGIAIDSAGNAYVTGQTFSTNFPTKNPLQAGRSGSSDAFVAKVDTSASGGASLVYSTYLGGSDADGGAAVAVDASGNAYTTGFTQSSNFPTANPLQAFSGGGNCFGGYYYYGPPQPCADAFVAKLDSTGSALIFSTYLGGNNDDRGAGIAVDSSGNSYVTGHAQSNNFPTSNPIQPNLRGSGDAFVAKLNATGSVLTYSTYLGGSGDDRGNGIAADSSGNAYVTGFTSSTDFPTVFPVQVLNSGSHSFITKLNPTGSALVYSSYLGGNGSEAGAGVAVDATGNAYVAGNTSSSNFPTVNPLQPSLRGFTDAFVSKIAPMPGPAVAMSRVNVFFTTQPINTTSPPQQVTLTNEGDGPLTISGITIAGTNGGDFAQTNTCGTLPALLASGASCTFTVTFTPSATGTRTGTLTISDNASGSPHTVSLLGNFVPPDFSISASPNAVTVSAGTAATSTVTIGGLNNFTGSVSMSCSGFPTRSNCSFSPITVTPGANPATSILTISTTAGSVFLAPQSGRLRIRPMYAFWLTCLGTILIGLGIWGRTPKKQRIGYFSMGLLIILLALQAGCGSPKSGATGTAGTAGIAGTPRGTYNITITGRFSSLQHSTTVTLTVQ